MTHPRGHWWWWPSRALRTLKLGTTGNRHWISRPTATRRFFFFILEPRFRTALLSLFPLFLYVSKCPVGPVFPCPSVPCASSREQFRTVSPLSISSFDRVERRQRVPAIRFSFPQNGKESGKEREEKEKRKIKVAQPLCYRWSSPKKKDAGQRCGHCPLARVPLLSHLFDRLDLLPSFSRKELAHPPLIIPLRALLSRNRISMDGQRPERGVWT